MLEKKDPEPVHGRSVHLGAAFRVSVIFLCCGLFLVLTTGVRSLLIKPNGRTSQQPVVFDFNKLRTSKIPWAGPRPGVKIDLGGLISSDSEALEHAARKGQPFMLVLVDP